MGLDFDKLIDGVEIETDEMGKKRVLRDDLAKLFENFYKQAKTVAIIAVTTEAMSNESKPGIVGLVVKDGKLAGSLNRESYHATGEFIANTAKTFNTVGLGDIEAGTDSQRSTSRPTSPMPSLNTSTEIITWLQMKVAGGEVAVDDIV